MANGFNNSDPTNPWINQGYFAAGGKDTTGGNVGSGNFTSGQFETEEGVKAGINILGAYFASEEAEKGLSLQKGAYQEQIDALRTQTNEQTFQRFKQLRETLSANIASSSVRGVAGSSPTFMMVQQKNFSRFNHAEDISQLNLTLKTRAIEQEEAIAEQKTEASEEGYWIGAIGSVLSFAAIAIMMA